MIDSDILIEVSRTWDDGILAKWDDLSGSEALLLSSPVTIAEIWHGARERGHSALDALFVALIREKPRREGDALIAAAASIHGLTLWTRNRKHYPMKDVSFY